MSKLFDIKSVGERILSLRKDLKLTQAQFAEKIKISRGYLSELEKGKAEFSSLVRLAICNVFAVNEQWLLYGKGEIYNDRWTLLENRAKELGDDIYQKFLITKRTEERYRELMEKMPEEEKPLIAAEKTAIYEDRDLAEIIQYLQEHPEDKKLILKLLKGKKDIKEALEGFKIKSLLEEEG